MREIIKQAPTVDEAIELGLKELGLEREDVTAEVLEYPGKKLFFKTPAKVKLTELVSDFNVKDIFKELEDNNQAKEVKQANKINLAPVAPAKPQQREPRQENAAPRKPFVERAENREKEILTEVPYEELSDKAKYAIDFLKSVVGQFFTGEYRIQPVKTQTGYIIKIIGSDAGCLIGRKGETMEALSYLTSLAANRNKDDEEKISVDVADYRQKREGDLQIIAKKMAIKVAQSGRPYTFEPMNPYERRIIHATIGEVEGVKSESKGEGSQRRVAIYSTAPRKPKTYGNKPGDRPAYNKPQGDRPAYNKPQGDKPAYVKSQGERPSYSRPQGDRPAYVKKPYNSENTTAPVQKTRDEKLVDDTTTALYSKVEF